MTRRRPERFPAPENALRSQNVSSDDPEIQMCFFFHFKVRNKVWGMSEGSRALISNWVHYDPPDKNFACKPRMLPNSQAYYPPGKNFGHQAKNLPERQEFAGKAR